MIVVLVVFAFVGSIHAGRNAFTAEVIQQDMEDPVIPKTDGYKSNDELALNVFRGDTPLIRTRMEASYLPNHFSFYTMDPSVFAVRKAYTDTPEVSPGYVISQAHYISTMKKLCPELIEFKMQASTNKGFDGWVQITKTYVPFTVWSDTFFCAPRAGYCGANFELVATYSEKPVVVTGKYGGYGDYLYLSTNAEKKVYPYRKGVSYWKDWTYHLCYIWKPVATTFNSTWNSIRSDIISDGTKLLMSTHRESGMPTAITRVTIDRKEMNKWVNEEGAQEQQPVAYVVSKKKYNKIKVTCPYLAKRNTYQRQRLTRVSWIQNSLPIEDGPWVKGEDFFCAPERGYCGADAEIAMFRSSIPGLNYEYSSDEWTKYTNSIKFGSYRPKISVCWGWTDKAFPSIYT